MGGVACGSGESLLSAFLRSDVEVNRFDRFGHFIAVAFVGALGTSPAGDRGIGDTGSDQADRANGIVVGRDHKIDRIGIAVGVGDRDDRDVQALGFVDRQVLALRINDEDRAGKLRHVAHTAEGRLEALEFLLLLGFFLVGKEFEVAGGLLLLKLLEQAKAATNGDEVGQRATKPAAIDVVLTAPPRLAGNNFLRLLNDRFGVQVRGGCSCAGTYGHILLGVDPQTSQQITCEIDAGDLSNKPGWVRVSLHPTMTDDEAVYVARSIRAVMQHYHEWKNDYEFVTQSGEFRLRTGDPQYPGLEQFVAV